MNMHEDMRTLLNAYLDGELHGTRLLEIKLHLASCEACRNELKELRLVSDLLQAAPDPEFLPTESFVSNLNLILPRRSMRDLPPKPGSLAWWLIPAGILGAWFFVQVLFTLSGVISAVETSGVLGQVAGGLAGGQETMWFALASSLFGGQAGGAQSTLALLNGMNVLGAKLLTGFLWQALIVSLYWGWLLVWWFSRRPRPMQMDGAS
jgi:anti-sigma factor RsiW